MLKPELRRLAAPKAIGCVRERVRRDRPPAVDLEKLDREYGTHLLGEGGEYETIVTDGPRMSRPLALEFEREWTGRGGRLRLTDARLEAPGSEPSPGDG